MHCCRISFRRRLPNQPISHVSKTFWAMGCSASKPSSTVSAATPAFWLGRPPPAQAQRQSTSPSTRKFFDAEALLESVADGSVALEGCRRVQWLYSYSQPKQ